MSKIPPPRFCMFLVISCVSSKKLGFIELKKVYVGIEIELSNIGKVYVYISKNPVVQHNFQFEEDYKIAKQIDKKLKRMALEKKQIGLTY